MHPKSLVTTTWGTICRCLHFLHGGNGFRLQELDVTVAPAVHIEIALLQTVKTKSRCEAFFAEAVSPLLQKEIALGGCAALAKTHVLNYTSIHP
jgi:hypothetical protein